MAAGDGVAPSLDATALVGLLADPDRRTVFATLVLGAATLAEVVERSALPVGRVAPALARLAAAGLVVDLDGGLHVLGEAFAVAARHAKQVERAGRAAGADAPPGADREAAKVFAAFVRDGRIVQVPAARGKRLILLDWLAQDFEIGRRYSESMVNLVLGQRHPDTAAWRRDLVDDGFLARADGVYWRSGGTATPDHS